MISSGGDGAAVICCGNPAETADKFIEWWKDKYLPEINIGITKINMARMAKGEDPIPNRTEFYHPRTECVVGDILTINYHDNNENYMFSNRGINLGFGDVTFVIKEDCESGDNDNRRPGKKFWIKSL